MSANTSLTALYCSGNQLTVLDVKADTELTTLICYDNQLTELDVTANTELTSLYCGKQTSDGDTAQMLTLTLSEEQKTTWASEWKNNEYNTGVIVAE